MSTLLRYSLSLLSLYVLIMQSQAVADSYQARSGEFKTPVVELYTSEGCSSCPPADEWLAALKEVPRNELDVLALAFHVDYWDYIGWKDEFASPAYTRRQHQLAADNRQNTVYTPEFFVNGHEARGTLSIVENIRKHNRSTAAIQIELTVEQQNHQFELNLKALKNKDAKDLNVQFVVFENDLVNQVSRGENSGRTLQHQRVVRYLSDPVRFAPSNSHLIRIKPDWKIKDLGIAALVYSEDKQLQQSVFLEL